MGLTYPHAVGLGESRYWGNIVGVWDVAPVGSRGRAPGQGVWRRQLSQGFV